MNTDLKEPEKPSKGIKLGLGTQIFIAAVLGILIGLIKPDWGVDLQIFRDIFLNLIKVMVAPLIFASIVQGIAGGGESHGVGRMGFKAIIYFEILTTLALVVGLLAVNVMQPGVGVIPPKDADVSALPGKDKQPMTPYETVLHMFPTSVVDSMARDDVLQVVVFSVLFGFAIIAAGKGGKVVLEWCDSLRLVMFSFAGLIMRLAPLGVAGALGYSVGHDGPKTLLTLLMLLVTLYTALAVFVIVVLGAVIVILRIPLRPFVRAMAEPFLLAFATANSEAALPMAFERMERFGVPRKIVGFVLPLGYSFNLDGTTLYLAVASVFVSQVAKTADPSLHFTLMDQITMMFTLMVSSKGVAAVPRASIVVLTAAIAGAHLPLEACAMILGVDAFMDMARTSVNVLGNCLASVVVAKWEGEFNEAQAFQEFGAKKLAA